MNGTPRIKNMGFLVTAFLADAAPVLAGEAVREDNSDIFVWIFLAFCALIIVAQLIPALMMMLGFAKGIKKKAAESAPETVNEPTPPKV